MATLGQPLPEPVRRLAQAIAPGTPLATLARLRMRGRIKVGEEVEMVGLGAAGLIAPGTALYNPAARHEAKVRADVTYTPDGGEPSTQSKPVKLKKRR